MTDSTGSPSVPTTQGEREHSIVFSWSNGGWVEAKAVCNLQTGSDCRLTGPCECEEWGAIDRREDGTIWHRIVGEGGPMEPLWHQVTPSDHCNVCEFLNAEPGLLVELAVKDQAEFEIGRIDINPVWDGDGYEWEATR